MYCPVCLQNTMKIRSSGVIKLSFNGKSRNTSLFTYNLQKETQEQLDAKLREKIVDFFSFYSEFNNKTPIKTFEAFSADFMCTNGCKIDVMNTKVSVVALSTLLRSSKKCFRTKARNSVSISLQP